ncbi:MAG: hypothetical protein ACLSA2_06705 [Candidatus Gastranaerophilaceae bacterium]
MKLWGIFEKFSKRVEYLQDKGLQLKYFDTDPIEQAVCYDGSNVVSVDGVPVEEKVKGIDYGGRINYKFGRSFLPF